MQDETRTNRDKHADRGAGCGGADDLRGRSVRDLVPIRHDDSAGQDVYAGEIGSGKVLASFRVKTEHLLFFDAVTENSEAKLHSVCTK